MILVTCIIPTMPEREHYLNQAIACVRAQTHPHVELLVDGDAGTIGAKRNRLCERASGDFIAQFDDDDLSAPNRIADQLAVLLSTGKSVTAYTEATARETRRVKVRDGSQWRDTSGWWHFHPHELLGASLFYRREWWEKHPFLPVNLGEDNAFINDARALGEAVSSPNGLHSFCLRNHGGNTAGRMISAGGAYTELSGGGIFSA